MDVTDQILMDAAENGLADPEAPMDDDGQGDALALTEGQADGEGSGPDDGDRGPKLLGSISPDGQVSFGKPSVSDDDDLGPKPPAPAGVFSQILTALDPYRRYEHVFPLDVFSPAVREAIAVIADNKRLPEKMIAGIMLSLVSALVLRTRAIAYKSDWIDHGNLFMLLVAPSGVGKSHAIKFMFKHIKTAETKKKTQWKIELKQYLADMAAYKRSKDPDRKVPDRPVNTQYLLDDATLEAVAERFEDNPRGFHWEVDEMAGWFDELDRYSKKSGGSNKKKLYKMFDCGTLSVARKSVEGVPQEQHYPGACLSILGGIQTEILNELFEASDKNQGLANRFLYLPVSVEEMVKGEIVETDIPSEIDVLLHKLTARGLKLAMHTDTNTASNMPGYIELDAVARAEFLRFRNTINETTQLGTPIFPYMQRMQSITLRIALLLHYLEYLENNDIKNNFDDLQCAISGKTMRDAIRVATFFTWGLRTVWLDLGYLDDQETSDPNQWVFEETLRAFIDKNATVCAKGLTAGEFFDLGLPRKDFGTDKKLRAFLRKVECPEKASNGIRFYPCELVSQNPNFGIAPPTPPKPKMKLVKRGMIVKQGIAPEEPDAPLEDL